MSDLYVSYGVPGATVERRLGEWSETALAGVTIGGDPRCDVHLSDLSHGVVAVYFAMGHHQFLAFPQPPMRFEAWSSSAIPPLLEDRVPLSRVDERPVRFDGIEVCFSSRPPAERLPPHTVVVVDAERNWSVLEAGAADEEP